MELNPSVKDMNTKRLKPAHLLVIRYFWAGKTYKEIADLTGYCTQQVMNICKSDDANEILLQLQGQTLDSIDEVQQEMQLVAPALLDKKIRLALSSPDDRVADKACTDLLYMAGHSPVKRIALSKDTSVSKKFEGLTEEDLRNQIFESLSGSIDSNSTGPTGPDGKLVN